MTPRRPTGHHHHGYRPGYRHYRHRHHYGCGHYGYGYGYGYGYSPFYWGLGWGSNVYVYGDVESDSYRSIRQGALDLDLRPETTEIYVDGAYVGVADQFDGFPTYLWLDEGTYELAFYKPGYQTIFRRYTIFPGVTIAVDDRMRSGEAVVPTPPAYPQAAEPAPELGRGAQAGAPLPPAGVTDDDGGRVAINATPGDAAVYLDGHFVGTAAELADLTAGLIVEPGDHVVDVIRPGYENQRLPLSVAAGERVDLELALQRP